MIAHLQDGTYGGAQILRPETARMMHGTTLTIVFCPFCGVRLEQRAEEKP